VFGTPSPYRVPSFKRVHGMFLYKRVHGMFLYKRFHGMFRQCADVFKSVKHKVFSNRGQNSVSTMIAVFKSVLKIKCSQIGDKIVLVLECRAYEARLICTTSA
jgi:hypothetical protein